jgi:hypothetical protein
MTSPPAPHGRRAALTLIALAPALTACSRPRPSLAPYGHVPLSPERLGPLPFAALPALRSPRPLVVTRFDDATAQPVGGAYEADEGPPTATYSFSHAALELSEHFCDALREAGLDARLAYAATPAPAGGEGGPRVAGALLAFQHDLVRRGPGPLAFVQAARAVVRLEAGRGTGAPAFAKTWPLEGRAGLGEVDLLARFGRWAAALAAGDAAFLAAVGAVRA